MSTRRYEFAPRIQTAFLFLTHKQRPLISSDSVGSVESV